MAQRWPQEGPKMAPRAPQDGPKAHRIAIVCCIIFVLLKIPRPRPPKTARRSPRDRPGTPGPPLGAPWDPPGTAQDGSKKASRQPKISDETATYESQMNGGGR